MKRDIKLAPSILSADFSDLTSALEVCRQGGASWIHVDVMDNQFVPNLTVGPLVVKSLRPKTKLFLDTHLMVVRPESLIPSFARAGSDGITVHLEACDDPTAILALIRNTGKQVGISIKPGTPVSDLEPVLDQVDLVLIMSVEPGFGSQDFLPSSMEKIQALDQKLKQLDLRKKVLIEVDGGIKPDNAAQVLEAGADILVAGSAIFHAPDPVAVIHQFNSMG
jgi:ribulose-phosphate 3-epimerase